MRVRDWLRNGPVKALLDAYKDAFKTLSDASLKSTV